MIARLATASLPKDVISCIGNQRSPNTPPMGDVMACIRARDSVSAPSWEGVASKVRPMKLYTAGRICSSVRSMMIARLVHTAVTVRALCHAGVWCRPPIVVCTQQYTARQPPDAVSLVS